MSDVKDKDTGNNLTLEQYLNRHENNIQGSARKLTNDQPTQMDFCQECRLMLCLIWRRQEEQHDIEDLDRYTRCAIWQKCQELFRSGHNLNMTARDRRTNRKAVELNEDIDERYISRRDGCHVEPEQLRSVIRSERLLVVLSKLSPTAKAVLEQLREVGPVAFAAAEEDYRQAMARRKAGQLVMNLTRFVIRKKHIAKQLGISPATISRAIAEIEAAIPVE